MALDDNLAVYDGVGQLLILLNVSAAAVWEGCDGSTTFGALVGHLVEAHADDDDADAAAAIAADAWQTVRKLAELGLVENAAPGAGVD